VVVETI